MFQIKPYSNIFTKIFLILACLGGVISLQLYQSEIQSQLQSSTDFAQEERLKKLRLDVLEKAPGFGFDNLTASWAFLDFVQYYGDAEARNATGYGVVPEYFETIVKKDPRYTIAFLYLDSATTLFAGQPLVAVDLLTYSTKFLSPEIPRAYQVWQTKATDELLFLGDPEAAQASLETAIEWAEIANTERSQNIADRMRETVAFLETNPDSTKAQISSWLMIVGNARDNRTRNIALRQIESLGGEVTFSEGRLSVSLPEED